MVRNVVASVETAVESASLPLPAGAAVLDVRMLGPLAIHRGGAPLALPSSRKVRALFGYLALAAHPVPRSQLCELLWDIPNDPRGELRWCLSKIRGLIDQPGRSRIDTADDAVRLDLDGCTVDVVQVSLAGHALDRLSPLRLQALAGSFRGEFLEGLDIGRVPAFDAWLTAQRRRWHGCRVAILERLVATSSGDAVLAHLDQWLQLAPFDQRAHEALLDMLARSGRIREGEEHLACATRLFEAEGLDGAPLRQAWRMARAARHARHQVTVQAPRPDDPAMHVLPSPRRGSIAVMPFVDHSGGPGAVGDALAHDVITRLAKLRSLFVIAQGTVFALHERQVGPEEAGRLLNVDYFVSGTVRRQAGRVTVMVELAETSTARIVWAEAFDHRPDDTFLVLDEIGNRIVASIASEIETIERNRAVLRPPNSLDAWEAHHRGLWHMYRFNRADNERARHFFQMAVRQDRTFARAHAGLSFTHFQNAFQGWGDRAAEVDRAYEAAGESLVVDDRDPAAHWAMGRALWLRGRKDQSLGELEQAIDLSPNFAQGHYALAFVQCQAGDPAAAILAADHSRHLSPFDPMLFGMLASRAMALVRQGRFDEAAEWALKAAARPNAHAQILAISAFSLALAGRLDEARIQLAIIHATLPRYGIADFLTAMHFGEDGEQVFRRAAGLIGLS